MGVAKRNNKKGQKYTKKIKVVVKNFPIRFSFSVKFVLYGVCPRKQEFHQRLKLHAVYVKYTEACSGRVRGMIFRLKTVMIMIFLRL